MTKYKHKNYKSIQGFELDFRVRRADYKNVLYDYIDCGLMTESEVGCAAALHRLEEEKIKRNVRLHRYDVGILETPESMHFDFKLGWIIRGKNATAFLGKALFPTSSKIIIGHGSYFSGSCHILGDGCLTIGNFCCIANNTIIETSSREHPTNLPAHMNLQANPRAGILKIKKSAREAEWRIINDVMLDSDVWIGEFSHVRSGVTIGLGAEIGKLSFVNKNVPPYQLWGGVPAKKIRDRFTESSRKYLAASKWWLMTDLELSEWKYFDVPFS